MKKILSLIASLAMILTLTLTGVSAAESTTYAITAPDNGHTYEVYQIFTGDLAKGVLSNVKWGANGTGATGESVGSDILDELAGIDADASNSTKLATITKYVDLATEPVHTLKNSESASVVAGYYLIKDKNGSVTGTDSYTTYIVKIVGNVKIDPKSDVPGLVKKVKDTNDTNGTITDWQDSADYDIGDEISFQLTGTVAQNYDDYKSYYFAFHDVEEAGLTFDADSVKVYVGDTLITSGYQVITKNSDGCTFEVVFADLKKITNVKAGSKITVEYTSTLNEKAILGNQGNVNKAYLEYSNNPNGDQGGTGQTKEDTVIVFTYKVVVNKVDSKNEPLSGATFTLEKFVADTTGTEKYNNINGTWKAINVFETEPDSTFTFKGLDDGIYRLKETVTPEGYNTIDDIYFEVTASHVLESDSPSLTDLNGNKLSGEVTIEFAKNLADGSLTTNVVNQSGTTLPETGGIGTTVFYVLGSVLVIASAVLLINKRKVKE